MTGYGLISKAGKNSFNRYKILGEKHEILGSAPRMLDEMKKEKKKKNKKSGGKIEEGRKKLTVLDMLKRSVGSHEKEGQRSEIVEKTERSSPVSSQKINSRGNTEEISHSSLRAFYSPSYKAQDKHIPTIKFKTNPTVSRRPIEEKKAYTGHHSPINPKASLSDSVKVGVPFEKQLSRDFIWMQHNLSDKRFDYSPAADTIKSTPIFEKQVSRYSTNKTRENFPDYQPQKEKFLKKISKNIRFDKYLKRELEPNKKILPDNYDVKFTYIDPKPKYCKFR